MMLLIMTFALALFLELINAPFIHALSFPTSSVCDSDNKTTLLLLSFSSPPTSSYIDDKIYVFNIVSVTGDISESKLNTMIKKSIISKIHEMMEPTHEGASYSITNANDISESNLWQ